MLTQRWHLRESLLECELALRFCTRDADIDRNILAALLLVMLSKTTKRERADCASAYSTWGNGHLDLLRLISSHLLASLIRLPH
jgi:hypothetical protein